MQKKKTPNSCIFLNDPDMVKLFDELITHSSDKHIIEIAIFNECNILINKLLSLIFNTFNVIQVH